MINRRVVVSGPLAALLIGCALATPPHPVPSPTPTPVVVPTPSPTPVPTPTPSASCSPAPTKLLVRAKATLHNIGDAKVTLDASALFGPDGAYCAQAGWTDGRLYCQVRPEGAPDQQACEAQFVPTPSWVSDPFVPGAAEGFLWAVKKIDFQEGVTYRFTPCFGDVCADVPVAVAKSW